MHFQLSSAEIKVLKFGWFFFFKTLKRIADNLSLLHSLSQRGGSQSHSSMFLSNTAHIKARGFKSYCSKRIGWFAMRTLEK